MPPFEDCGVFLLFGSQDFQGRTVASLRERQLIFWFSSSSQAMFEESGAVKEKKSQPQTQVAFLNFQFGFQNVGSVRNNKYTD